MLVCNEDYAGQDIDDRALQAQTLGECISMCAGLGTACMGVTWVPLTTCWVKFRMIPSGNPGFTLHSAVRVSGPGSPPVRTQVLKNQCFESDLTDWRNAESADPLKPANFDWLDGTA